MTTPTGFKFYKDSNLVDFADVFEPGNSGTTTGFINASGNDLGNLFASGNSGYTTGYKNSIGTDLGTLFQPKSPFSVTNSLSGVQFTSNFAYAIFTDTVNQGTVTRNPSYTSSLNFIVVGGGGGGGRSGPGQSNGGGGGGGVYLTVVDTVDINPYIITIGKQGSGQTGDSSLITSGGFSQVTINGTELIKCTGGGGGTTDARGIGGVVYEQGILKSPAGVGGDGGDRSNGSNSYYYYVSEQDNRKLGVPNELIFANPAYISYYYSGGGGGGKGSSDTADYSPGEGGGTYSTDVTVNPNTGLGGNAGISGGTSAPGKPGNGYGSGGGGGGYNQFTVSENGGNGKQGIVIVYAAL
jgi:hypothetical protein